VATGFRVGFCVSGNGHLFQAAALQSDLLGVEPALVVAGPRASPEVGLFCRDAHIPFVSLPRLERKAFDVEITRVCAAAELDLLSLTFDKIIPPQLVEHYRGRIINTHMSLLPAFKGLHGLAQALEAGARFAGATIHEVTESVDDGAIIAQCVVGVCRNDNTAVLGQRLFASLRQMYLQVLAWYAAGRVMKDARGSLWVRDAVYGQLPISPAVELTFPDHG
jgi:phosphoribosylglycinamide formyltransferase-1